MRFNNSKEVDEYIVELHDKIQATYDLAKEEDRELAPDETQRVDGWLAEIGEDAEGDKPATGLCAIRDRLAKVEKRTARLDRNPGVEPPAERSDGDDKPKSLMPARAKRWTARHFGAGQEGQELAYKCGQWFLGAVMKRELSAQWTTDYGFGIKNAQTEGDDLKGGVLVPDELENMIIRLVESRGIAAQYCRQWPMGSAELRIPRRTGGVTVYFVGEATAPTASNITFDSVNLIAKKAGALTQITGELAEDAVVSVADLVAEEFGYGFADKQDECLFNGDGTSTYGGMNGLANALAAGCIQTADTGELAFSDLDLDDFQACMAALPEYQDDMDTAWYISRQGYYASVVPLLQAAGGNTIEILGGAPVRMFGGFPVRFTQVTSKVLTDTASTIKAYLGNLRQGVAMGVRRGMSMTTLNELYATSDQIGIVGFMRFHIVVHETGTSTTCGSIAALKTPAA